MNGRDFDQLVDLDGLDASARRRLHGVHELLLSAGPPPELTPALAAAPTPGRVPDKVVSLASRRRRPLLAGLAFAATVAAAAFGGGFLLGHGADSGLQAVRVVGMQGEQNSLASIKVGKVDANGNWPIEFSVDGLPALGSEKAYYILMLEQNGKPRYPCGTFRVANGTTTVRFTVPYEITGSSRWVVTSMAPGAQFPGHVVMTTS
jgi:hypothetical protein